MRGRRLYAIAIERVYLKVSKNHGSLLINGVERVNGGNRGDEPV